MERIHIAKLCCSIKKSDIHVREIEFLGYHISPEGISISTAKVESVKNWPVPRKVKGYKHSLASPTSIGASLRDSVRSVSH